MFTTVLPVHAQKTLAVLGKSSLFADAYLAGGTGLALQLGHRESIDFDFFTQTPFEPMKLSRQLSAIGSFNQTVAKGISLIGEFEKVKMSYFQYDYPLLEQTISYEGVSLAHMHDIAAMKLVAICDRSTKKDYIDLYTLVRSGISFEQMFALYDKKYHAFDANKFTLIKSMTYFQDAELGDMPRMFVPLSWDDVKSFLLSESLRLGKIYLEGTESTS